MKLNKIISGGEMKLNKIISGGQSGADIAALEVALFLGLETGGTAPNEYMTTLGSNMKLKDIYHLDEFVLEKDSKMSLRDQYIARSKLNVDNSDGTIAFPIEDSIGTRKAISYCKTKKWEFNPKYKDVKPYKPLLVLEKFVDKDPSSFKEDIRNFLIKNNIRTLNVIGTRNQDYKDVIKKILTNALYDIYYNE